MFRSSRILAVLLVAAAQPACAPEPEPEPADDDDSSPALPQPADLAELSDGECPDFAATGASTFSSAGVDRTVLTYFPDDAPFGMPVVFFWHSLGTTASDWVSWLDLDGLAFDLGAVVFVPQARESEVFEWDWVEGEEADGPLFDDLRTCAVQELGADVRRVAVTGFSAGAVWTSWLAMHRADTLSTAFVMSGGLVPNLPWSEPSPDIPVMAMSGGDQDVWTVIDFDAAMQAFVEELVPAGHFVAQCRHDDGHTPGPGARGMMEDWLEKHSFGEPSPWSTGDEDVAELADYCFLPE